MLEDRQIIELYWQKTQTLYRKPPINMVRTVSRLLKTSCTTPKIPRSASMIHGFMPGTRYHRKSLTYFGYSWRRLLVIFPLTDSMHEMQRNGAAARLPSFWRNWKNVLAAVRIQRLRTRPKNCGKLSSVLCGRCRSGRGMCWCAGTSLSSLWRTSQSDMVLPKTM